MEPISISLVVELLAGLASPIRNAVETFERLERLPAEHRKLAHRYKQSVTSLHTDVNRITDVFHTIIKHGDEGAVNALLGSNEGDAAYRRLTQTLDSVESHIKKQIQAVDKLVANVQTKTYRGNRVADFVKVARGQDVLSRLNANAQSAFQALSECREGLQSDFQHFHRLYELQHTTQMRNATYGHDQPIPALHRCCSFTSDSRTTVRAEQPSPDELFHIMKHGFRDRPFRIEVEAGKMQVADSFRNAVTKGPSLHWEDQLSELMKSEGMRWVDQAVRTDKNQNTVAACQQAYNKILSNMAACVKSMATFSSKRDDGTASACDPELESISYDLASVMRRAESNKISVAFCGMVKAG